MDLNQVENMMMTEMDDLCDALKIDWQPNGIRFRNVLLRAIKLGYDSGCEMEQTKTKREKCKHDFNYSIKGGTCKWCGQETGQDSSD